VVDARQRVAHRPWKRAPWSREGRRPRVWALLVGCAAAIGAGASDIDGRVVAPFVPTTQEDVERMLDIGDVGPGDYLIDLGSGDGRIVIAAAARGAVAHGIEISDALVELARENAAAAGVASRTLFLHGDIFEADIGAATVVTMFLMPDANLALRPKLLAELSRGTRVVSNSFDMGDWHPDGHIDARTSGGILLWVVPAQAAGHWQVAIDDDVGGLELTIEQAFQRIMPVLAGPGGQPLTIEHATLRGDRIAWVARGGEREFAFHGTIADGRMSGLAHVADAHGVRLVRWSARRVGR
jgi:hypothetical protein